MDMFRKKSTSSSRQSIEEKSPKSQWNIDSIWTTESDEELSNRRQELKSSSKKPPSIKVINYFYFSQNCGTKLVKKFHLYTLGDKSNVNFWTIF